MHIVFANSTKRWGGVKTWIIDYAVTLADHGHRVTIFGRQDHFIAKAVSLGLDARPFDFGSDYNPRAIRHFMRFIRIEKVDCMIGNVGRDMRTAGIAARLSGIPLIQQIGLPDDMRDKLDTRLTHYLLKPWYWCSCEYIRNGMLDILPFIPRERTRVILTAKKVVQEPPHEVGSPLRLIVTSQLNPDKGHRDLFMALGELRRTGLDFSMDVLGTGSIEAELRQLARELGIADRVAFHGFRKDVSEFLKRADALTLPSLHEGLPNTLQEAMAHGLVIIARDVGGMAEVWPESMRDFLVPPSEGSAGFTRAIGKLLRADAETVRDWKRTTWAKAGDAFDLDDQVRKFEVWLGELRGGASRI